VYSLLTSFQLDEGASHVPLPCVLAEKLRSSRGLMQMNTHVRIPSDGDQRSEVMAIAIPK